MTQVSSPTSPFFIGNPLNDYINYTYKFKLFMTQDQDFLAKLYEGDQQGEMPVSKVFEALDNTRQVVIAQSGVTAGYNIKDVRMESVVAPNMETTNTGATQFVINIHEPLGTSLVEMMRNAALELQVRNLDKTFYFLELTFDGYLHNMDTSDTPLPDGTGVNRIDDGVKPRQSVQHQEISEKDYDNGGRWLYQIAITNIETELDASGSRYTLTAIPYNEGALDHTMGSIPKGLMIQGATIESFLADLKTKLNAAWRQRLQQDVYTFDFKVHPFGDTQEDPSKFNIIALKPEENPQRSSDWTSTNGNPTYHGRMGQAISTIIETAFSCTRECQDRAYSAWLRSEESSNISLSPSENAALREEKKAANASAALFIESRLFRIEPDIEIKGYDYIDKVYRKHVTFHIWPFYTQMPLISRALAENAKSPEVQSRMIGDLHSRGFFRKRYDYIYTGLNTEVIRLDIRYNLAWSAVLPIIAQPSASGFEEQTEAAKRGEEEAPTTGFRHHTQDDVRALQQNSSDHYQTAFTELAEYDQDTQDLIKQRAALSQEQRDGDEGKRLLEQITARNSADERARLVEKITITSPGAAAMARSSVEADRRAQASYQTGSGSIFAEDMEVLDETEQALPHTISFHLPFNEAYNSTGAGMQTNHDTNRGVYGAILEQSYGPLTTGLINIDMEIRGDPYWLSHSNVERRLHMKSGPPPFTPLAKMANYMEGDCVFLLNFSYPFTVDDETGDLVMRENEYGDRMDKFTGLYRVVRVTNTFEGGEFRQTLKAQRFPLLDFAKALGFSGTHAEDSLVSTGASPATPSGGAAPASAGSSAPIRNGAHLDDARAVDPRLLRVVERARAAGPVDFDIADGVRSRAEQEAHLRSGASFAPNSRHLTGDAVDLVPRVNGRRTYLENMSAAQQRQVHEQIRDQMNAAARAEGVELQWGGEWRRPYDPLHFELKPRYR